MYKHVYLVIGVSGDENVIKYKGDIIMSEMERAMLISHCKWVNYVIVGVPWSITPQWCADRGIHYLAHDDIYNKNDPRFGGDFYYDFKL